MNTAQPTQRARQSAASTGGSRGSGFNNDFKLGRRLAAIFYRRSHFEVYRSIDYENRRSYHG